jgi:hypothetical protein
MNRISVKAAVQVAILLLCVTASFILGTRMLTQGSYSFPSYDSVAAATPTPPPTASCQLPQNITSEYEVYRHIHEANFSACMAGQWVYEPSQAFVSSPKYVQCLDQELQGNCHDPSAWENTNPKAKESRHESLLKNAVSNSPGILNGSDPWAWQSNLSNYKVVTYNNHEHEQYRKRISTILSNRTIYLVGDSLTRQWGQTMRCEIMHILGKSNEVADTTVSYLQMHVGFEDHLLRRYGDPFRNHATERDYVIFNFGHHVGKKLGDDWPPKYTNILKDALAMDFGKIPDHHIFFRTTTVRHFLANQGDWNTNSSKAGGIAPNMQATWNTYGGNLPELPRQNLIAFNVLLRDSMHNNSRRYKILDTSPMMLARGDASFDGSHFCLPGPMQYWSRMLYYQIEQNNKLLQE